MVKIKFPDGNVKEFESGVTGMDIAKSISHKLAKEVLSISVKWRHVGFDARYNNRLRD